MEIKLLNLINQYKKIEHEIKEAIDRVLDSGQYILGEDVEKLENEIANYCEVKYAVAVASGTDALLLSLKALGVGKGDEVILPTFTFFATAGVISRLGAVPVFVDICEETYNINVNQIEDKITKKTKAIIPVHLYGLPAEMDRIMSIASKHNIFVVEDACQSIGASYKGKKVGGFGHATALSFFPSKNLGAYGDGGMILTDNVKLANDLKSLRVHGSNPKYFHSVIGYNSRLDTIQAAILRVKLKYLEKWTDGRRRVANNYSDFFIKNELDKIIKLPIQFLNSKHVFHQYVISLDNRDELKEKLSNRGISTAVYYPLPLHLQDCYKYLGYNKGDFPNAELASDRVLALPIDSELSIREIEYIVKNIKSVLNKV